MTIYQWEVWAMNHTKRIMLLLERSDNSATLAEVEARLMLKDEFTITDVKLRALRVKEGDDGEESQPAADQRE